MAVIKKSDLEKMNDTQKAAKIAELERAIIEMYGEGRKDKVKPLKKAIASLKTPRPKAAVKSAAGGAVGTVAHPQPVKPHTAPQAAHTPSTHAPATHSSSAPIGPSHQHPVQKTTPKKP